MGVGVEGKDGWEGKGNWKGDGCRDAPHDGRHSENEPDGQADAGWGARIRLGER